MIGRTIGNYVVRDKIGEGGMGVVFRAEHPHINRRVAIKVLHPGADRNPEVVHRFFNEARAATEIRNEHIVEVLDFGTLPEGMPYLVMEWLDGESLGSLLRSARKLPLGQAALIMNGIARALRAAHGKGVVHRDLKPDNVFLVRRDGEPDLVKVLDFGIAKLLATGMPVQYQTQTGAIIGTPAYMSPEQCRGAKEIDHRTDVYALGVIGYQMLTGRLPFAADALGELLLKHLTETPAPADSIEPSVPGPVSQILARALEKEPEKRPGLDEIMFTMDAALAADAVPRSGGATAAALSARFASTAPATGTAVAPGPHTTLGASASEIGLDRKLPPRHRTGLIVGGAVAGLLVTAGVLVLVMKAPREHAPRADLPMSPPAVAERPAPTAPPAAAAKPAERTVDIAIRTDPGSAHLEVDGEAVGNPFSHTVPRDGQPHRITASLPGFGPIAETISFDRDRELILKLIAVSEAPSPRSSSRPRASTSKHAKPAEAASGSPEAKPSRGTGYRGSNLNIETQFP
jgi:hypothetical protein